MGKLSEESLNKFKEAFKESYGYEFKSDQEANEAAQNLIGYFEILIKMDMKSKGKAGGT